MDDDLQISGGNDTGDIIDLIKEDVDTIAYGLDSKMRDYQIHYTIIKTRYKRLAFTWLIATFIGFSYFLRGAEINLHLNNYIVIFIMSLLSSLGLFLLYFLDIGIYQRVNEAIFLESLELEKKHPFLGVTGQNVFKLLVEGKSHPIMYEGFFYAAFTTVLLIIADLSIYLFLSIYSQVWAIITSIILFICILFIESVLISSTFWSSITTLFKDHLNK